ncbi:MAG: phosphatidate cytidylyltransferase [Chloroflexi bacterium]|nr:phosphatidate cytidylyltransferase [Chloroflexota bacterium]
MRARVLSGVVAIPVLLFLALYEGRPIDDGGWLFRAGLLVAGLLGTAEALHMARAGGYRPSRTIGLLLAAGLILDASLYRGEHVLAVVGVAVAASLAMQLTRSDFDHAIADWSLTLALPLYAAGLVSFFAPLREVSHQGFFTWPALLLLTSWSCDSAAFFTGRALGKTKLAPSISPGKTVEGMLGGLAAASVVGGIFAVDTGLGAPRMAGFGLAVGLASVVGDLAESLLKRQCAVKDSGILIPGHGGILDRMDALIFSAVAAYLYLRALG